jgi:hypothetical protein
MASYIAVKLYGPGHVVAYNYIADFHDGINVETYGNPDGSVATGPGIGDGPKYPPQEYWDRRPVAIDFYNNYITNSHDNPIEADGSMHNIRVMRNMLINHASHAFCNQPALGGPGLLDSQHRIQPSRRVDAPYKRVDGRHLLQQHDSFRDRRESPEHPLAQQSHARAELDTHDLQCDNQHELHIIGLQRLSAESGSGDVVPMEFAALYSCDGSSGAGLQPNLETRDFATLAQYSQATGQDRHSILVDYDIFMNVRRLDAQDIPSLQKLYKAEDFDFRLKPGSAAVDRGVVLPNVRMAFQERRPISAPLKSARRSLTMGRGRNPATIVAMKKIRFRRFRRGRDVRYRVCAADSSRCRSCPAPPHIRIRVASTRGQSG